MSQDAWKGNPLEVERKVWYVKLGVHKVSGVSSCNQGDTQENETKIKLSINWSRAPCEHAGPITAGK